MQQAATAENLCPKALQHLHNGSSNIFQITCESGYFNYTYEKMKSFVDKLMSTKCPINHWQYAFTIVQQANKYNMESNYKAGTCIL